MKTCFDRVVPFSTLATVVEGVVWSHFMRCYFHLTWLHLPGYRVLSEGVVGWYSGKDFGLGGFADQWRSEWIPRLKEAIVGKFHWGNWTWLFVQFVAYYCIFKQLLLHNLLENMCILLYFHSGRWSLLHVSKGREYRVLARSLDSCWVWRLKLHLRQTAFVFKRNLCRCRSVLAYTSSIPLGKFALVFD